MSHISPKVLKLEDVKEGDLFVFQNEIVEFELTDSPGWLRGHVRITDLGRGIPGSNHAAYARNEAGTQCVIPIRRVKNDYYCMTWGNKPSVFRLTKERLNKYITNLTDTIEIANNTIIDAGTRLVKLQDLRKDHYESAS